MYHDHKSDIVAVWQSLRDLDWNDALTLFAIVSFTATVLTWAACISSGIRP